ncbi:MAG TPA: IgGFc-binding protein [Polyangia bacterium]
MIVAAVITRGSCGKSVVVGTGGAGAAPQDAAGSGNPPAAPDAAAPTVTLPDASVSPPPDATIAEISCGDRTLGNAGCSFMATEPPLFAGSGGCYALVVVNPGTRPAKLSLQRAGTAFRLEQIARLPRGSGPSLVYQPYTEAAGLAPGDLAILFLAGASGPSDAAVDERNLTPCPQGINAAVTTPNRLGTSGMGQAFHLTSDRPVIAYDVNPYGGVHSYVTSSSLLIPIEAWSGNYLAAVPRQPPPVGKLYTSVTNAFGRRTQSYVLVTASQDGTEVSLRVPEPTVAGAGVPAAEAGQVVRVRLDAGQVVQVMDRLVAENEIPRGLSGTVISANKPVGVIGGSPCMHIPAGTLACDAAHQQVPPLSAWGQEYVGIRYRNRFENEEEAAPWQLMAAVDGTVLTYSPRPPTPFARPEGMPAVPAPTRLAAGQTVHFWTNEPFVVRSQDTAHPIHLAGMMTGGAFLIEYQTGPKNAAGDPEFVNVIPTDQYMNDTTFFTDPTYSETSLVVVRKPGADGQFADVTLGCAPGPITGWSAVGALQFARVDLVSGKYEPQLAGCDNGAHRLTSVNPFTVTVWGWSTRLGEVGGYVSYAYPGGTTLRRINDVQIVP